MSILSKTKSHVDLGLSARKLRRAPGILKIPMVPIVTQTYEHVCVGEEYRSVSMTCRFIYIYFLAFRVCVTASPAVAKFGKSPRPRCKVCVSIYIAYETYVWPLVNHIVAPTCVKLLIGISPAVSWRVSNSGMLLSGGSKDLLKRRGANFEIFSFRRAWGGGGCLLSNKRDAPL